MDWDKLRSELRRDEGYRDTPYRCSAGALTLGFGRNLTAHGQEHITSCTVEQAEAWLDEDICGAIEIVKNLINNSTWERLSDPRQRVLVNMAYCLGSKLGQFRLTLRAVYESRWKHAAEQILASKFAQQTGQRANRLAEMMREG